MARLEIERGPVLRGNYVWLAHEPKSGNPDLVARMREKGIATVPSRMEEECRTNPFFRPDSRHLQETVGLAGAARVEVFTETRKRKDAF